MKKMCILMLVLLIINCLSGCNYIENKIAEFEKEQEEYRFKNDIPLDSINAGFGLKTYSPQSENGLPPFFGFKSDTGTFNKDEIEMEVYYGWKKNVMYDHMHEFPLIENNDNEYVFHNMSFFLVEEDLTEISNTEAAQLFETNPEFYEFFINNMVFSSYEEIPGYHLIKSISISDFQNEEYILTFEEIGQDIFGRPLYRGCFNYKEKLKFPSKLIDDCLKKSLNNKSIRFYLVTVPIYYCQELNTYKLNLKYKYNGHTSVPSTSFIEESLSDEENRLDFILAQSVRVTFDAIVVGDEVRFMKVDCKNIYKQLILE